MLTYAFECVKLKWNDLPQLDRPWNFILCKVFKTYDKDCIADIQISISQSVSMAIDTGKIKYIGKLKQSKKTFLAGLIQIFGYLLLTKSLSNMQTFCNNFKDHLLHIFCKKIPA